MKTKNKFSGIKVQVSSMSDCDADIKRVFMQCLEDYCERFNVLPVMEKIQVQICLVEYPDPYDYDYMNGVSSGLTVWSDELQKILIQVRDPFLSDWENNYYVMQQFISILMHEFVHACQHITGREQGSKIKINYDKSSEKEMYLFDPAEMEARMLELPYFCLYGQDLL